MTAKRTNLGFLDTCSKQLADYVVSINSENRLDLLFRCLDQFPREILNDSQIIDAIAILKNRDMWVDENIERIGYEAHRTYALSIDADEIGNNEEFVRLSQISSIFAAVSTAMEKYPLSAEDADKCLYYMSEVLTDDFVKQLLSKDHEES